MGIVDVGTQAPRIVAGLEQDLAQGPPVPVGEGVDPRIRLVLDVRRDQDIVAAVGGRRAPLVDGLDGLRRVALEQEEGARNLGYLPEALVDEVVHLADRRHVKCLESDRIPERGLAVGARGSVCVHEGEGGQLMGRCHARLDRHGFDCVQRLGVLPCFSLGAVVNDGIPDNGLHGISRGRMIIGDAAATFRHLHGRG